jgi:DNA-binding beta-propeller fold protein YncE
VSTHTRLASAVRRLVGTLVATPRTVEGGRAPAGGDSALARRLGARPRALAVIALTVGITLSLAPGVAQAKLVSYGNFGSGQLGNPVGVAVDQSNHDVYVANLFGNGVDKFDSSGNLISPPSPFGSGSSYSGVAVNPANGDVYALNALGEAVETYDPSTGVQLGSSFAVPGPGNFFGSWMVVQIASDAAGNVYVANATNNEVQEYSPTGTLLQAITGSGANALSGPTGVAVGPAGNVWVADTGNNRIEEFDPTGAFMTSIASSGVQAVAVDATGDVFAVVSNSADCGALPSPCYHVVEYSAAGAQLADVGAGTIGASPYEQFGVITTLAVDDATGKVYVADGGNSKVWIFGPPAAPTIGRELAEQVTASAATLGARLNPGGLDTSYHFDYGTTSAYGQTVPVPAGDAGSGVQPTTVWATASGLAPDTTYHYRVVASSSLGTVTGADQTFTTTAATCPNDQFRTGFSAGLPDCRAYEMVTPANKDSGAPGLLVLGPGQLPGFQVASDGNRAAYFSHASFPGSLSGSGSYLATRGAGGWSSENLIPPQSGEYGDRCAGRVGMQLYSADLSTGILADGQIQSGNSNTNGVGGCSTDYPNLVPGEPQGFQNLFLRDNINGGYQLADVTPQGVAPTDAILDAGSSDLSHVVFDEQAQLTADAPSGADDLYEWTAGAVRLVSYVPTAPATQCGAGEPACTPAVGALAGGFGAEINHAVSVDGSRIFFTAGGKLYVRLNGSRTAQVDASRAGGSGGGGTFQIASADGTQVFFTDDASAGLTSDTVPGSGANLYSYNTVTGELTDLTPQPIVDAARVLGASDDGSYVYFTAGAVLAPGAASEGPDHPNLYLYHAGTTTFVATFSEIINGGNSPFTGRVSANGLFIAFTTSDSLTGYDTAGTCTVTSGLEIFPPSYGPGGNCSEIYLYDAASHQLSCASCNPAGDPPYGNASLATEQQDGEVDFASTYPEAYDPNSVSDSGQVFFDTPDALLPADTNGKQDVYEYAAGRLHLLSGGTSADNSWFVNATSSGSDVFFVTSQQLLPQDGDSSPDLYDARVGGGFPPPPAPPTPCVGDACRPGAGAPPPPPLAASVTFFGPGNASATATAPAAAKVRILSRVVHGSTFSLRVEVPGRGRITITGNGIRRISRFVGKAGTYKVKVTLTPKNRKLLARKRKLKLELRVSYASAGGQAQAASVTLTVEPAFRHAPRLGRRAHRANRNRGGAR